MTSISRQPAAILIDIRKSRIRINKNTLHALGNPTHIDLIINPDKHTIGIGCGSPDDKLSHRINSQYMQNKACIELYSRALISEIRKIIPEWTDSYNYRIQGAVIPEKGIAQFRLENAVPVFKGKELTDGQ